MTDENNVQKTETENAGAPDGETPEPAGDTFSREYVEKLRGESARSRKASKEAADRLAELEQKYVTARVAALGELADPSALPYSRDLVEMDDDALAEHVTAFLKQAPHMRRVGAGGALPAHERGPAAVSLVDMLRRGL